MFIRGFFMSEILVYHITAVEAVIVTEAAVATEVVAAGVTEAAEVTLVANAGTQGILSQT